MGYWDKSITSLSSHPSSLLEGTKMQGKDASEGTMDVVKGIGMHQWHGAYHCMSHDGNIEYRHTERESMTETS